VRVDLHVVTRGCQHLHKQCKFAGFAATDIQRVDDDRVSSSPFRWQRLCSAMLHITRTRRKIAVNVVTNENS
jgi:hypothetical protein